MKYEQMNEQQQEELGRQLSLEDANRTLIYLGAAARGEKWTSDLPLGFSDEENVQNVIRWLNHGSHLGRIG